MSRLFYGGQPGTPSNDPSMIELPYVHTKQIIDEPLYSDDGTEYLYTRRFVHIESVISSTLVPSLSGESSTQTMARIKHLLETPRRQLYFYVGTDLLFQSPGPQPQPGSVDGNGNPLPPVIADAKWGPFPRGCTITRIGGTQSFNIDYAIETFVQECPGQSPENPPPEYLSHRWQESISIDERAYSRRTRTGKIVTRSDFYTNPDSLRGIVTPRLLPGFRRITSEYVLQSDGLAMQYTFVDQEVFIEPPAPAFKAEGEYIESVQEGAIRHAECRVRLEGSKTDFLGGKARLLQMALLIVRNKLELAGVIKTGQYLFLKDGAIREDLYDNVIEVRYRGMMQPLNTKSQGAAVDLRRFCWAPTGSDIINQFPPDPGERGTALLDMFANFLNDPCAQQAVLRITATDTLTAVGTQTLATVPIIWQTTVLPDSESVLRSTDTGGVYTNYKIHAHHEESPHVHQLAVAQDGADAAFVQLAAPTSRRVEEWTAERAGQWPKMPPVNTTDSNLVYLGLEITNREVQPQADGSTPRYILSGRYRYGHVDYTQASLDAPVPPYVDAQFRAAYAKFPSEAFEDGITNASESTNVLHRGMLGGNLPTAQLLAGAVSILPGLSTTLTWTTTNAATVLLADGTSISSVAASGSTTISPLVTTGYRLSAYGPDGGIAEAQATVVVLTQ